MCFELNLLQLSDLFFIVIYTCTWFPLLFLIITSKGFRRQYCFPRVLKHYIREILLNIQNWLKSTHNAYLVMTQVTLSIMTLAKVQGGLLAKEHWDIYIYIYIFPTIFAVEQGS